MSGSFDAIIANGMATVRESAAAAARSVDRLNSTIGAAGKEGSKQFRDIGAAISKMGGPLAEISGKFFGGAGMEGGMARLAVAATLAGVAFKAFTSVAEAAEKRAQAFAAAVQNLDSSLRSARQAQDQFAAGSIETGRTKAVAENLFGDRAGEVAGQVATKFKVDEGDILKAMAASGAIPRAQRRAALEAAAAVAATGEVTAAEAMTRMAGDQALRQRVIGRKDGTATIAGMPISGAQAGAATLLQSIRGATGAGAFEEAAITVGGRQGAAGDQLAAVAGAGTITTRAQVAAFDSGQTAGAAITAAARAANPMVAAQSEWLESMRRQAEEQRNLAKFYQAEADKTWNMFKYYASKWKGFWAEQDARRTEVATGQAVNGTGGN